MAPRIREALKKHELRTGEDVSWSELGRRVWRTLDETGDSAKWVSRVKLGQQEPSVAEGGAISYLLDVSPVWLFWEIGEIGRFPKDAKPTVEATAEAVPTAPVVVARTYEEERAATKKAARKRPSRGAG